MLDQIIPLAQSLSVALIAAWLTLGVRDNLAHPAINEVITAQVLAMSRMKAEYPDEFARVAHRAITDRRIQKLVFRIAVLAELAATLLLWVGVLALWGALAGAGDVETAKALALGGTLLFTVIWAAFLIVGNYFCYWLCHEGAQNTHYQMTLWGLGTMIFLVAA